MTVVYVGLGSNLNEPVLRVKQACSQLAAAETTEYCRNSCLYRSAPVGMCSQGDFINAVCELKTSLALIPFFHWLQQLQRQGDWQRSSTRWGPRTLDLDLLWFGGEVMCTEQLQVPHPRCHERRFVLQPWAELAPDLPLPNGRTVAQACADCAQQEVVLYEELVVDG